MYPVLVSAMKRRNRHIKYVNPMYQRPQEMLVDFYFSAPIEHFQSYWE